MKSVLVTIRGVVQGVGFRYWTRDAAVARGITGYVRNLPSGEVEARFEGPESTVDEMITICRSGPRHARVEGVGVVLLDDGMNTESFEIRR